MTFPFFSSVSFTLNTLRSYLNAEKKRIGLRTEKVREWCRPMITMNVFIGIRKENKNITLEYYKMRAS